MLTRVWHENYLKVLSEAKNKEHIDALLNIGDQFS